MFDVSAEELFDAIDRLVLALLARHGSRPAGGRGRPRGAGVGYAVREEEEDDEPRRYGDRPKPEPRGRVLTFMPTHSETARNSLAARACAKELIPELLPKLGVAPGTENKSAQAQLVGLIAPRLLLPTRWFATDARKAGYDLVRAARSATRPPATRCSPCGCWTWTSRASSPIVDDGSVSTRRGNLARLTKKLTAAEQLCVERVGRATRGAADRAPRRVDGPRVAGPGRPVQPNHFAERARRHIMAGCSSPGGRSHERPPGVFRSPVARPAISRTARTDDEERAAMADDRIPMTRDGYEQEEGRARPHAERRDDRDDQAGGRGPRPGRPVARTPSTTPPARTRACSRPRSTCSRTQLARAYIVDPDDACPREVAFGSRVKVHGPGHGRGGDVRAGRPRPGEPGQGPHPHLQPDRPGPARARRRARRPRSRPRGRAAVQGAEDRGGADLGIEVDPARQGAGASSGRPAALAGSGLASAGGHFFAFGFSSVTVILVVSPPCQCHLEVGPNALRVGRPGQRSRSPRPTAPGPPSRRIRTVSSSLLARQVRHPRFRRRVADRRRPTSAVSSVNPSAVSPTFPRTARLADSVLGRRDSSKLVRPGAALGHRPAQALPGAVRCLTSPDALCSR